MTDPNLEQGKKDLALAILGSYVRHEIQCGTVRGLSCDCGLSWHLTTTPWLKQYLPTSVLRAIEYKGESQ